MRAVVTSAFLLLAVNICLAQTSSEEILNQDPYVYVFVTAKGKVMLNGNKSAIGKLESYLDETEKKSAKIGTVKPTPMKAFSVFQQVVKLCEQHNIEALWYRDPEFSTPFFDEN